MSMSDGFTWTQEPWGMALRSAPLSELADHFFTTRQLRLRGESEDADWTIAAATIGVPADRLLRLTQVHGRHAVVVRRDDPAARERLVAGASDGKCGAARPEADILASDDPSIALAIQVADCVPLLIADRKSGAVAAVHAGWRGTIAGAAPAAVETLRREFGAAPEDLVVVHGPSIGACCYNVGTDLVEAFVSGGFHAEVDRWFSRDEEGFLRLDLWEATCDQLLAAGVRADDIHQSGLCTASHPQWFASYRRDGPGTGRIAAVIRSRPLHPSRGWPTGPPRR
jgi:polyphenol oxidase